MSSPETHTENVHTPAPADEPVKETTLNLGAPFLEAAALLLVWSILVMNEGALRFNETLPYNDLSVPLPATSIPRGVFFIGGLFEVIFGLIGLFLAGSALVFRFFNAHLTMACMALQSLLGWYVFIVFVMVFPGNKAAILTGGQLGLSIPLTRFLITLGLFTSAHFCLALQGGQFIFMARLITSATGKDFLKQKSGAKMRAVFWNCNIALAGFWTLITGAILNAKVEAGTFSLSRSFAFPPNVGASPGFTIFTGLIMLAFGAYGAAAAVTPLPTGFPYYITAAIVYLFAFLNYTIVQFGLLLLPGPGGIGMHNGLIFMIMTLGPYFLFQASKKEHVEENVV